MCKSETQREREEDRYSGGKGEKGQQDGGEKKKEGGKTRGTTGKEREVEEKWKRSGRGQVHGKGGLHAWKASVQWLSTEITTG